MDAPSTPLAVIDVGSNSGRVVLFRLDELGHLEILADGRSPLRLALDLRDGDTLSERTIEHTVGALRDFRAIATSSGAGQILAVATSAVRESANGDELVRRCLRDAGIRVVVIDGETEARYAYLGAVRGLPVADGMLMDIGGGSVELSRFRGRELVKTWTLPLGALRMSDRFLTSDPPATAEVDALAGHVRTLLAESGVGRLEGGEQLVGTGGTVRNLAKVDRYGRGYPIPRLHGYTLTSSRLDGLTRILVSRRLARRRAIAGLSSERADSIAGGAVVALTAMEVFGAPDVLVSGQGLREGLVYDAIGEPPPAIEEVRRSSIDALASRFATWDPTRARRRVAAVRELAAALEPKAGAGFLERLDEAAAILDVGRSIDYYRRFEHTADMLVRADLIGFSHRRLALLAAVVRQAGDEKMRVQVYRPLLSPADRESVARASTMLAIADQIEHRLPPGGEEGIRCEVRGGTVLLEAPVFDEWRREAMARRLRRVFGKRLVIQPERRSDDRG
jgi:exopolyphosphatase/guanosine-5'-triphosphate,3'-diphosphate pyrophosphatase